MCFFLDTQPSKKRARDGPSNSSMQDCMTQFSACPVCVCAVCFAFGCVNVKQTHGTQPSETQTLRKPPYRFCTHNLIFRSIAFVLARENGHTTVTTMQVECLFCSIFILFLAAHRNFGATSVLQKRHSLHYDC